MTVTKEGTNTRTSDAEDIVLRPDTEVVSRKCKRHVWEVVTCLAFDIVLAVGVSCSTHLFISRRCKSRIEQNTSKDHT